jgi:hypothetical protein
MVYNSAVANQTLITSPVDITGTVVTFTATANRRYRFTTKLSMTSTVATDTGIITIFNTSLVAVQHLITPVFTQETGASIVYVTSASLTGSQTYRVQAGRWTGTGTVSVLASATDTTFMIVEDIGPLTNAP